MFRLYHNIFLRIYAAAWCKTSVWCLCKQRLSPTVYQKLIFEGKEQVKFVKLILVMYNTGVYSIISEEVIKNGTNTNIPDQRTEKSS